MSRSLDPMIELNKAVEELNEKTNIQVGTVEWLTSASKDRHKSVNDILRNFAFAHLTGELRTISSNVANLALQMCAMIKDDPELVVGLRKLAEAKDCFVRAAIYTSLG